MTTEVILHIAAVAVPVAVSAVMGIDKYKNNTRKDISDVKKDVSKIYAILAKMQPTLDALRSTITRIESKVDKHEDILSEHGKEIYYIKGKLKE